MFEVILTVEWMIFVVAAEQIDDEMCDHQILSDLMK